MTLADVESASGDHCCRCRGALPSRGRPRLRGLHRAGSPSSSPATGPKATPPSSHAHGDRRAHPARRPPAHDRVIVELRARLAEPRPRRRPGHDRLAPPTPPPARRLTRHDLPHPARAGLVTPEPQDARSPPTSASKPNNPTRPGSRLHPLPPRRRHVDIEILSWLDDHSRYALSVTAHLRVTGAIVAHHLPQRHRRTTASQPPR